MKTAQLLARSSRVALRRTTTRPITALRPAQSVLRSSQPFTFTRAFASTPYAYKGLQPHTSDPEPPNTDNSEPATSIILPAELSESEYHEIADQYLDTLQLALEEKAEDAANKIEAEYSAGVLTITTEKGTYVINKQPNNRQIWLSSPISGPKRFDFVTTGAGQNTKEGTETTAKGDDGTVGGGKWWYAREEVALSDLLAKEIGVETAAEQGTDVNVGREGPGGSGGAGVSE